jgi:hypothetical protein
MSSECMTNHFCASKNTGVFHQAAARAKNSMKDVAIAAAIHVRPRFPLHHCALCWQSLVYFPPVSALPAQQKVRRGKAALAACLPFSP